MTAIIDPTRNANLPTLMDILNDRQARKIDLVVPASQLSCKDGDLVVSGLDPIREMEKLDEETEICVGETDPNGRYQPTSTFDEHLAERLDIHPTYLRRLRHGKTDARGKLTAAARLDLFDTNVNGLLHGTKAKVRPMTAIETARWEEMVTPEEADTAGRFITLREAVPADKRSFLVRLFRSDESGRGIARALLSNRYARMDDIDGLMAMLKGISEAGVDPATLEITGDLTETRMYVHVRAPEVACWAPDLLEGYRSPFDTGVEGTKRQAHARTMQERIALGQRLVAERGWRGGNEGGDLNYGGTHSFYKAGTEPIIHAGFKLMNSELGNGRWMLAPEFTVLACDNGLVQTKEIFARTHVGSKMDDGHVEWSLETQTKELAWVTSQTVDLVRLALSQDYLESKVAEMTAQAGHVIADADKAVEVLGQRLKFSKAEQEGILRHFLLGGQSTAGGLMAATTSFSQTLDPDAAFELDGKAMQVLELATRL